MQLSRFLQTISICLTLVSVMAWADEVEYAVTGVDEPMLTNVRNHVTAFRLGSGARLNARLRRNLTADAIKSAENAMRPFGYFNPVVDVSITNKNPGEWLLSVSVQAGPPVLIEGLSVELTGPGTSLEALQEWAINFPLF